MSKYPEQGLSGVTPADLSWLTGNWKGLHGSDQIEEYWSSFNGGTLMGMFRWQKGEQVWFYEFMTIESHGEHILLRIKHFYPGLKGWEEKDLATEFLLVQFQPREAVFLQINKPGPWMIYHLEEEDKLISYFEKEGEVLVTEEIFEYKRQKS